MSRGRTVFPVQSHRRFALTKRFGAVSRYATFDAYVAVARIDLHAAYHELTTSILSGDRLSRHTIQVLNLVPEAAAARDLHCRLDALEAAWRVGDNERHLALAELTLQAAIIHNSDRELARRLNLLAAYYAHRVLFGPGRLDVTGPFDRRSQLALGIFDIGSARYFQGLMMRRGVWSGEIDEPILGRIFTTAFVDDASMRTAYSFDEYHLAWGYRAEGLRNQYYREGVGAPMVALRTRSKRQPLAKYFPKEGETAPLTVLLRFEPDETSSGRLQGRIAVHDPRHEDSIALAGRTYTLTADFTAPLAFHLSRAPARRLARRGLFGATDALRSRGIRLLEPYDPHKIPVLMVHGLASSPQTWRELTNDIMGSPELRGTYQIWHYMYATSQPFLYAAQAFRSDLRQLFERIGADSAARDIVVIGHSMGGLLAKSMAVASGLTLWNAVFTVSPEKLDTDAASLDALKDALVLEPWPAVRRLVFLGVPHHGSEQADSLLASAGKFLIHTPKTLRRILLGVTSTGLKQVQPAMHIWFRSGTVPISLQTLSPNYPLLKAFASLAIDARVPFHSIIGGCERDRNGRATDGYVTVDSAHLEGAASELVVPIRHGNFDQPLVLNEVYRILRLHAARLRGTAAKPPA